MTTPQGGTPYPRAADARPKDGYGRYLDEIARLWGDLRVAELAPSDALVLRDRRAGKPAAAN